MSCASLPAVDDRGQRYEVSYFDPRANCRSVLGWTNDAGIARRMAIGVELHPVWALPVITDRASGFEISIVR